MHAGFTAMPQKIHAFTNLLQLPRVNVLFNSQIYSTNKLLQDPFCIFEGPT